jgi:hypothetical protein
VASELAKQRLHRGLEPSIHHYREVAGLEVDLLLRDGLAGLLVEAKSGQTMDGSFLDPLLAARAALEPALPGSTAACALVHGGDQSGMRREVRLLPWRQIEDLAPVN